MQNSCIGYFGGTGLWAVSKARQVQMAFVSEVGDSHSARSAASISLSSHLLRCPCFFAWCELPIHSPLVCMHPRRATIVPLPSTPLP